MSIFDTFARNDEAEGAGVWITEGFGGASFKLARAGGSNKRYRNAIEREHRKHRHAIQSGTLKNAEADELSDMDFARFNPSRRIRGGPFRVGSLRGGGEEEG